MENSRIFKASLSDFDSMMQWVRDRIEKHSSNMTEMRKFEIAIEEAVVNVISYAYPAVAGLVELSYEYDPSTHYLSVEIKDSGIPFNPIEEAKKANLSCPLEERAIGGLGIHFIKEITDEVQYQRTNQENILRLTKEF